MSKLMRAKKAYLDLLQTRGSVWVNGTKYRKLSKHLICILSRKYGISTSLPPLYCCWYPPPPRILPPSQARRPPGAIRTAAHLPPP